MEEINMAKVWFVNRAGEQTGPISFEELKTEAQRGALNPRLDKLWKEGMDQWIVAGDLEGLFERNEEARAAEQAADSARNIADLNPHKSDANRNRSKEDWPGVGRAIFFIVSYLFPVVWILLIKYGTPYLEDIIPSENLFIVSSVFLLLPVLLIVATILKRLQNLGMSRLWFLGLLIPVLGLWVYYRIFACPPGYAKSKKLDVLGWSLAIVYWLLSLAIIVGIAGAVHYGVKNPEKIDEFIMGNDIQQLDEFWERAKEQVETKPSE